MISAIMKIGKWAGEKNGTAGTLQNFVQNPNEKGGMRKVLAILLSRQRDGYRFENVDVEEFTEKRLLRYLYRRGAAMGADATPTSKFAGDILKTFNNRIIRSLRAIMEEGGESGLSGDELKTLGAMHEALVTCKAAIEERLLARVKELEKGDGAIITLVLIHDGTRLYLGDLELFQKVLISKSKSKYFQQYGTTSLGREAQCSVCQTGKPEVYGFVNTYNFYTVDKPGFVTGGFKQRDAWKNYPVCLQCACNLELGRQYLNDNLNYNFYGFRYLLVPKFFDKQNMQEILDILERDIAENSSRLIETDFRQKTINRLTSDENEILELLSTREDSMNFDMLFYREKQAAFNILLHVEDVLPSRFRRLFATKARLDEIDIFSNREGSGSNRKIVFNFKILRDFFPYESKTRSFDEHFLDLVGKIFSLKPIDYQFLLHAIMRRLRSKFVQNEPSRPDCLSGYMLLNFLVDLHILSKGGKCMDIRLIKDLQDPFWSAETDVPEKIDLFFEAHSGFFDLAEKKACFLVGVLVQKLLNIQWKEKRATPFRSRLQSLCLNEQLIKKLAYESQNKLEEYKKNYYPAIESLIAQYMIAAGPKWESTNDEISFYFTLGMNLAGFFKTKKESLDEDEEGDDEQPDV